MADPATSVKNTLGGFDQAALVRAMLSPEVPYSEWAARRQYGATLDTRQIEEAIRSANYGIMWPITDLEMETLALNPAALSFLARAFVPIATADWDLTPAEGDGINPGEAKKIATDCRSMVRGIRGFKQGLLRLAWSFAWGRGAVEKEMVRTVSPRAQGVSIRTVPVRLNPIPVQRLSFDQDRRLIAICRFGDTGMFLPRGPALDDVPGKFVQLLPAVFDDLPEREGLAVRFLYWLLMDRFGWRRRMEVMERMGGPTGVLEQEIGKTPEFYKLGREVGGEGGSPGDDANSLDNAAAAVRRAMEAFGIFVGRPGEKFHYEWPPSEAHSLFSEGSDQILRYLEMLATHAAMMSTAARDGARANLIAQKNDTELLLDFRGGMVAEVVQRDVIDSHVELNYGADALPLSPSFAIRTTNNRDRDKEVDRLIKVSAVVPVGIGVAYEASGFRPPNPGEPTIDVPAPAPQGGFPGAGGAGGSGPSGTPAKAPDEGSSADAIGALRDLAEGAEADDQRDAADEEAGAAMARWFAAGAAPTGRKLQPSSANGSPETIVERGVREGTRSTSQWADALVDAADGQDGARIYRNLQRVAAGLDLEPFTRAVERRLVHGLMLGGLDADTEMNEDAVIAPATFAAPVGIANFTTLPFGEAIKDFLGRNVITRRTFDRLAAAAKRKAFTVAGLQRQAMLATAHDELSKALVDGSDLRTFSKALGDRFDAAGWTRLNPSHVETVFRTNVMGAYSAGRREQMTQPTVLAARPYWQILGVKDSRTRKPHYDAIGKVLPAGDPFWDKAGPPFGFNCRCRPVSRSQRDLDRLGLTPTIGAALHGLPDEGWDASGGGL